MKARILMTSVGGLVAPNIISGLKTGADDFYILGVDNDPKAVGFYFCDKHYVVLRGDEKGYAEEILKIARKEKIDIVIPGSDEELLALSERKEEFRKLGIVVAVSDKETVRIACDKAKMLEFLKGKGVEVPQFIVPRSLQAIREGAKKLGYPKRPVVFKPTRSRGARGFWLIDEKTDYRKDFLLSRDRQQMPLELLLKSFEGVSKIENALLMEYLPGDDFNVDVLAFRGKSFYTVPHQRLEPKAGPVRVGLMKSNPVVEKAVREIVEAFGFDYWVNVEVAFNQAARPRPLVYEINPRISAPIIATKSAGVDLLRLGIYMILGKEVPIGLKLKTTRMIRYWNELFVC